MIHQGQRVGEYVLDAVIGRGAFGEVWRAKHHAWTEQLVAIKIPTDAAYLAQLQREGFAAPQLVHPNIVRAIGFDPFAAPPYLAMEYVAGPSLRAMIQQKSIPPVSARAILLQVLDALDHAHGQGVVHRDIKPENILLTEKGQHDGFSSPGSVKLTDFGLGQSSRKSSTQSIAMSMNVRDEQAREIVGTLDYMSPEQRVGGEVDARSDLYACGVVLFEMLTGDRPAGAEVPSDLNKHLPDWADPVFRKAYARKESRFASADDFKAALGSTSHPPPLPSTTARQCPRCQGPVARGDQFCISCGKQLVAHVRRCAACGSFPGPDERFCTHCGSTLNVPSVLA
jgi:serine/threonine protein kinase